MFLVVTGRCHIMRTFEKVLKVRDGATAPPAGWGCPEARTVVVVQRKMKAGPAIQGLMLVAQQGHGRWDGE